MSMDADPDMFSILIPPASNILYFFHHPQPHHIQPYHAQSVIYHSSFIINGNSWYRAYSIPNVLIFPIFSRLPSPLCPSLNSVKWSSPQNNSCHRRYSVRATLKHHGGYAVTQADRGENQREKSKVSPLPVSPYYTTLSCTWTHYLVRTDPMLHRPLTDSGCTYASYFTSTVTLEVKVERSSDLWAEWSLEMGVERSSNSKSGVPT